MNASPERDGLDLLKRDTVDHVHAAARVGLDLRKLRVVVIGLSDRHIDPSSIGSDIDEVGVTAEWDPLGHLQGLAVDNGEYLVGLVADIDSTAVRGDRDPMRRFHSLDLSHHLVRDRVDDVCIVPGRVCLEDPDF